MKKILLVLLSILLFSTNTYAATGMVGESFTAGDRVAVHMKNNTSVLGFTVLQNSLANEDYVWLLYDGAVAVQDGVPAIYDEDGPSGDATSNFNDAEIKIRLQAAIALEGWVNYESATSTPAEPDSPRLLKAADLDQLPGIQKVSNGWNIMGSHAWLAPKEFDLPATSNLTQEDYNYWTMIPDGPTKVYVVKYNAAYAGNATSPVATIVSEEISGLDTPEHAYRPVVKVHKKWIDCKTNETTTTTPKNPQTAAVELPTQLLGVAIIAGVVYVIVRKKENFTKI